MSDALKPVKLGPFRGVNTRARDTELRSRSGDWLRMAVNVDRTDGGAMLLRPGFAQALAADGAHSLFADGAAPYLFAQGATLQALQEQASGLVASTVRSDLTPGRRLSYARHTDGRVFWSNGVETGWVNDAGAWSDSWGGVASMGSDIAVQPMPAGNVIRFYQGQLLSARGSALNYSLPWAPATWRPAQGRIPMDRPIQIVAPLETGLFVATDRRTYWIAGDLRTATVREVLPVGAAMYSDSPVVMGQSRSWIWMSPRGLVRGTADGAATCIQESTITPAFGRRGATLVRERDGLRQAIGSTSHARANGMGVGSFMTATVRRKGEPQ